MYNPGYYFETVITLSLERVNVNAFIRFNLEYTTIKKYIKCYWDNIIYKMSNNLIYKCKLNIKLHVLFSLFKHSINYSIEYYRHGSIKKIILGTCL